jgi:alanyl aminopeptidase
VPAGAGTLRIEYTAPFRKRGDGLHHGTIDGAAYGFTQFQPIDARRVFPGFDEPAFKTPFDITVTAHAGDVVIGNGPVIDEQPAGDGLKRVTLMTTEPLPTYLLAFAVGPLDVVDAGPLPPNDVRDRPLPFRAAATRGSGDRLRFAIDNTQALVDYLEDYFAVAYPYPKLDIIASPERGTGAMENAGAIIYGDAAILLADNAPQEQRQRFVAVHAHELAHHWFGNLVTPEWWDDIWLNESFASWMGNKAAHAWRPEYQLDTVSLVQALAAMNLDGRIAARQIRQPVDHNRQIASSFDAITYLKGGGVLSMFESYLGEEGFRDGLRVHMRRFPHGVADVEDFMASLAEGSGRPDVVPAFRSFIDQPGVPLVDVAVECGGDGVELALRQSRYLPEGSRGDASQTWLLPLCVRYAAAGKLAKDCMLLDEAEVAMPLAVDACPDFVMPNADGAGYYRFSLSDDGWRGLMDGFGRLSQKEALVVADSLSAAYQANRLSTSALLDALRVVVASPHSQVAMAPAKDLVRISETLVSHERRDAVLALMRQLYRPRLDALAPATGATDAAAIDRALFRTRLVDFLALDARDPDLRADLARRAERFVAGDDGAVAPALLPVALAVGVQERGAPFAAALIERWLASNDMKFRAEAATALAATDDAELGDRARGLILDDRLRGREATTIAFALAARPSQRRATFDWFRQNEPEFTADMSHFATRWLPRVGVGFCTVAERDEVDAYFAPLVAEWQGAERTLAEVLEGIELCAALRAAKAAEVDAYFTG